MNIIRPIPMFYDMSMFGCHLKFIHLIRNLYNWMRDRERNKSDGAHKRLVGEIIQRSINSTAKSSTRFDRTGEYFV